MGMSLYLGIKNAALTIIEKNFPPEIASRFSFKMDSEIFKPSEDEGTWLRKRKGGERLHVFFDLTEIFEIPERLTQKEAEWWILRAFRDAVADGVIVFTKKAEAMSQDDVKKIKNEKAAKKKVQVQESFKEALANPMTEDQARHAIAENTKKAQEAQKLLLETEDMDI